MTFKDFSEYLQKIENTAGRNDMTVILAELLGKLKGKEIRYTMYLLQGRLVPKYVDLEFNISGKLILRALASLIEDEPAIKELYSKLGDAGLVAESVKNSNFEFRISNFLSEITENSEIEICDVYDLLKVIAEATGKGSQEEKMRKYNELILSVDALSAKYITRMITGTLRLGVSEKTILDSLSWFKFGDKSIRKELDTAFGARADVGQLAEIVITTAKENISDALKKITATPGTPMASKLVEREASSAAVWERMPNCFVQPKLDGLRGQIHFKKLEAGSRKSDIDAAQAEEGDLVAVYSRNMENMTTNYPEILEAVKNLGVDSIILDSEIIGYDEANEVYRSYQDTMKRRRKYDIDEFAKNIPVKAMCFDILYLNDKDLTEEPIETRLELLRKVIGGQDESKVLDLLETLQMKSEEELEEYYKSKVENGLEGIITKEPGSNYEPGTRNFKWIKLKANSRSDLVDTIDVAILGYYIGRGDRARFGFGAMLAGVYDPETDKYQSIGKVGSGFKEEEMLGMLKQMSDIRYQTSEKPENYEVEKSLFPDVWIKPEIIAEVDADEITRSPNHTAARGMKSKVKNDDFAKGLSIRFPRMKKWKRDKNIPNTSAEIVRMYELRKGN